MDGMGLPALINCHFPTHGNWQGLAPGPVVAVWLAYILSRGDHRLSQVQPWVAKRRYTLSRMLTHPTSEGITELDWADDRLAAVLPLLAEDTNWQAFESAISQRLLRVYSLEADTVRIDTTSTSGYWSITEGGLFQFGPSKDQRPMCRNSRSCFRRSTRWDCLWQPMSSRDNGPMTRSTFRLSNAWARPWIAGDCSTSETARWRPFRGAPSWSAEHYLYVSSG